MALFLFRTKHNKTRVCLRYTSFVIFFIVIAVYTIILIRTHLATLQPRRPRPSPHSANIESAAASAAVPVPNTTTLAINNINTGAPATAEKRHRNSDKAQLALGLYDSEFRRRINRDHFIDFDENRIYKHLLASQRLLQGISNHALHTRYKHILDNRNKSVKQFESEMTEEDIHGNQVIYAANGIIYGNPFLISKCRNAVFDADDDHDDNINNTDRNSNSNSNRSRRRKKKDRSRITQLLADKLYQHFQRKINKTQNRDRKVPWVWSRETVNEWIQNTYSVRRPKVSVTSVSVQHELQLKYRPAFNHSSVVYAHIMKSASTSIGDSLLHMDNGNGARSHPIITVPQQTRIWNECGFTFVRHPISRFVSAYYTINALLHEFLRERPQPQGARAVKPFTEYHTVRHKFAFWNIWSEPQRFRSFVRELLENSDGVRGHTRTRTRESTVFYPLYHMETQSGLLSSVKFDLHFVFKYEYMKDFHFKQISRYCPQISNQLHLKNHMRGYGVSAGVNVEYQRMMDLTDTIGGNSSAPTLKTIKPAYVAMAMDRQLYDIIVEYYKQDFICFGYTPNYEKDILSVTLPKRQ